LTSEIKTKTSLKPTSPFANVGTNALAYFGSRSVSDEGENVFYDHHRSESIFKVKCLADKKEKKTNEIIWQDASKTQIMFPRGGDIYFRNFSKLQVNPGTISIKLFSLLTVIYLITYSLSSQLTNRPNKL
jgi:hypothetical protein